MNSYYEINIASHKSKDTNTSSITMNEGSSKYLEILNDMWWHDEMECKPQPRFKSAH